MLAVPAWSSGTFPSTWSAAPKATVPLGGVPAAVDRIGAGNVTGRPTVAGVADDVSVSSGSCGDLAPTPAGGAAPSASAVGSFTPALRRNSCLHSGSAAPPGSACVSTACGSEPMAAPTLASPLVAGATGRRSAPGSNGPGRGAMAGGAPGGGRLGAGPGGRRGARGRGVVAPRARGEG